MNEYQSKKLRILVFDCAIKTPSTPCLKRLQQIFDDFIWLNVRALELGDTANLPAADIYIIFGSYSNVEDRLPWHRLIARFCDQQIAAGVPTLGICFGHQLMADYYGARVEKHPSAPLKGLREIEFKSSFAALKNTTLGVSHSYEVTSLPRDFEVLATSKACAYEALKHRNKPYYSFQAHPEGSSDFFRNECPEMSEAQLQLALGNGASVIKAFLQIAQKVLA